LDLLAVAAEPFAVARAVIGNNPNQNLSAILMDVGGGTTDIAVINDGGVQGTKMFGIGGRAYTRAIERDLSVEFDQAEQLKVGLSTNKVPTQKRPAIETVHHIRPDQVAGISDKTGDVQDHTFITAMGLLRVGVDTMQFGADSGGSIRDKIDKMLSV
jgi:cell division ATPase FtsA